MQKGILFIILLININLVFCQKKTANFSANELKGNVLLLAVGGVEATYERDIDHNSGIGIAAFVLTSKVGISTKFSLTPYYRRYFGNEKAKGAFVEGFGMLNFFRPLDTYTVDFSGNYPIRKPVKSKMYTDFALGLGFGNKWVTSSGFIIEANIGFGKNLINNVEGKTEYIGERYVGRLGISIGKRF